MWIDYWGEIHPTTHPPTHHTAKLEICKDDFKSRLGYQEPSRAYKRCQVCVWNVSEKCQKDV